MMWKATEYFKKGACVVWYFNEDMKEQGIHRPGLFWAQYQVPRRFPKKSLDRLTLESAPEGMRDCRRNIQQQAAWNGAEIDVQVHVVRYFDEWDREVGYYLSALAAWVEFEQPKARAKNYRERLEV